MTFLRICHCFHIWRIPIQSRTGIYALGEHVLAQENGHTREMSRSQKRAMETASVSHDEEHQHAVISFADGAKVQQNSETTKDKEQKKELPPVTPLGTNRRGISKAA